MPNTFTRSLSLAPVVAGLLVLLTPTTLGAKGTTVRIEVTAPSLAAPIKITDPRVHEFSIWAGPGVNGTGTANAEGFIVSWKQGIVAQPPSQLVRYELSFYAGCTAGPGCTPGGSLAYVVSYAFDASSLRGFVYLPGEGEPLYSLNVRSIYHGHGVEGHWFPSTETWDSFVGPIIAKATLSHARAD